MTSNKQLIFVELNEINFELVDKYIKDGAVLPNLSRLKEQSKAISTSENTYEHLEPWIQWPSVHTGKTFHEHKIFRLGDVVKYRDTQIFETVESRGYTVGVFSAMNADNRLTAPAFFIPDPWTNTAPDKSFISRALSQALSQTVNDNTGGKITSLSALNLLLASLLLISPIRYPLFVKKLFWALQRPWRKAMFLDFMLSEYFITLLKRKKPDFATIFLNAGAHIQHHYLLSSHIVRDNSFKNPSWYVKNGADPVLEIYVLYDEIIGRMFNDTNSRLIVATGLSQKPCEKPVFYYRLKEHAAFLTLMDVKFSRVEPRMTRDFLITFEDNEMRDQAVEKLSKLKIDGTRLFGHLDKRPLELFVTMDYPFEILPETVIDGTVTSATTLKLSEYVNFVAIKNGEHQGKGFVFIDSKLENVTFKNHDHVAKLYDTLLNQFPEKQ